MRQEAHDRPTMPNRTNPSERLAISPTIIPGRDEKGLRTPYDCSIGDKVMRIDKHTALILAARAAAESGHQDASDALLRRALKREAEQDVRKHKDSGQRDGLQEPGDTTRA